MISVHVEELSHVVEPTIFPDGTSQVWKIPRTILARGKRETVKVVWRFAEEREIIDVMSLSLLLYHEFIGHRLHVPFLPFGRQDKDPSNISTFNLHTLMRILSGSEYYAMTTVDAHSVVSSRLCNRMQDQGVREIHEQVCKDFVPDVIVSPDRGAEKRYGMMGLADGHIVFDKIRDNANGQITSIYTNYKIIGRRFLIIDDICDGGATFIGVAKAIREKVPLAHIGLFVTHGVFSKGVEHLLSNGIDEVMTTDSLIQNSNSKYKV